MRGTQSHPVFTDEELDKIVQFHNLSHLLNRWVRSGSSVYYADGFCQPTMRELETTWASYYRTVLMDRQLSKMTCPCPDECAEIDRQYESFLNEEASPWLR